eukprot:5337860-Pyramimonas_sp.AAC.1
MGLTVALAAQGPLGAGRAEGAPMRWGPKLGIFRLGGKISRLGAAESIGGFVKRWAKLLDGPAE